MLDVIIEFLLEHGPKGIGAVGGIASTVIYQRFRSVADKAEAAGKHVALLATKLQDYATKEDLKREIANLRGYINAEAGRILRGSKSELISEASVVRRLDIIEMRINELEKRMSGAEDDADQEKKEKQLWTDQLTRSLGRVEGTIEMLQEMIRNRS